MTESESVFITLVEGPAPEMTLVGGRYELLQSLAEGPTSRALAECEVRTFDGAAMIERCRNAWADYRSVQLDAPDGDGGRSYYPIVAAQAVKRDEGDALRLWLNLPVQVVVDFIEDDSQDD